MLAGRSLKEQSWTDQGLPRVTEADIPDIPPPLAKTPVRDSFASDAAYDEAKAEHQAAAARRAEQMKERRKMQERLREQKRDRSGRARPDDDGAKATERRRKNPVAAANHRQREADRYEAARPEITEADMAITSIVDAGESRPDWEWLKGAKVSQRARKKNAQRRDEEQAERDHRRGVRRRRQRARRLRQRRARQLTLMCRLARLHA